jgi:hypothetical protein
MSDKPTKETCRTVSFWVSEAEMQALERKAAEEKVTRNEAARRAIRQFTTH